jgi:hypothetical protein
MFEFDGLMSSGWMLVISSVLSVWMIAGFISSRKLPEIERRARIRKFGAVGLTVLLGWVLVSDPPVPSYTNLSDREYQEPANLETTEQVVKQFREQNYRLERVEREAVRLREDLYNVHQHYRILLLLVVMVGSTLIINRGFPKKNQQPEEEIQTLNL